MSVSRQLNVISQMRLDVPHIRLIESAVAGDFDTIVGRAIAGESGIVIRGFTIAGSVGAAANTLSLVTADGIAVNLNASESGSFLWVEPSRAAELLDGATNGVVQGAFVPGAVNYVGIDFVRELDDSTIDLVKFKDPVTEAESDRLVPLGKVMNYRIVISTTPFSTMTNVIPVAKVTVSSTGAATAITDARQMMYRLGAGGDVPDSQSSYSWPAGRTEGAFTGGDKSITSQKEWQDAVMTRLWELGGGTSWFNDTADRNVNMINLGSPFANGDYMTFDSGTGATTWQGFAFLFDGGEPGVFYNLVAAGSGVINDLECLYVDLDRTVNRTGGDELVAAIAAIDSVGTGTPPGSRWILAYRIGTQMFMRNWRYPIGTTFVPATDTSLGVVMLNAPAADPLLPQVVAIQATGVASIVADGTATIGSALTISFTGSNAGFFTKSGASITGGANSTAQAAGVGVFAFGGNNSGAGAGGAGINATGGSSVGGVGGAGVKGTGGTGVTGGNGVEGYAAGASKSGVVGDNSVAGGIGVKGTATGAFSVAVYGVHTTGAGIGVAGESDTGTGVAGTGTVGVKGFGAVGGGTGVEGRGVDTGSGVNGYNNAAAPAGVAAINGISLAAAGGIGVWGVSTGIYEAIKGEATGASGTGVTGQGGAGGAGGSFTGGAGNSTGLFAAASGTGNGVNGTNALGTGHGVRGSALSGNGVHGLSDTGHGVYGTSNSGRAFHGDVGDCGINPANKYEFTAAKTGYIFVPVSEMQKVSGNAVLTPSAAPLFISYYPITSANTARLIGNVRVPRGATLTNIDVHAYNGDSVGANYSCNTPAISSYDYDTNSTVMFKTALMVGGAAFTIQGSGTLPDRGFFFAGACAATPVNSGSTVIGNSGVVEIDWSIPLTIGTGNCHIAGLLITYTYDTVDFMI